MRAKAHHLFGAFPAISLAAERMTYAAVFIATQE